MTKDEALKIALDALENSVDLVREDAYQAEKLYGNYPTRQGQVNGLKVLADDHEKAIAALRQALANEALDKMAENARELGLDYEPMQPCAGRNCGSTNSNLHSAECFEDYDKATGMAQPVAWQWLTTGHFRKKLPKDAEISAWNPLFTSPPQRQLESTTDMMMGLAERLGELPDDVDPRAWSHLLVYAPQRQPEQEPVAWMVTYGGLTHIAYTKPTHVVDTHYQPLYASPPHRKQLTNDELLRDSTQ